ncbi:MAG: nitrate- and nitrite sensing domain-containing protein [Magnetococcales bacterium]|nr:nitrate- and nitrite sensing domain-containing protein [Magnetococcales bacterium]
MKSGHSLADRSESSWIQSIDGMKLTRKFILMLLFPVAGMLFFSITGVLEKNTVVNHMEAFGRLSSLAEQANGVVHQLQKEQSLTAGRIGLNDGRFQTMLKNQQATNDPLISALNTALQQVSKETFYPGFQADLQQMSNRLATLDAVRQGDTAPASDLTEVMQPYTDLNHALLQLSGQLVSLSPDVKTASLASTYHNLVQSKERAGYEQGLLGFVFGKNHISTTHYAQFNATVAEQKIFEKAFLFFASPKQATLYQEKMARQHAQQVVTIRQAVLQKGAASPKLFYLSTLHEAMGFGGAIHQFKNFLLRGTPHFLDQFNARYQLVVKTLADYQKLDGLSQAEKSALETIRHSADGYHDRAVKMVDLFKKGEPIESIDSHVMIDDTPALNSFKVLAKSAANPRAALLASLYEEMGYGGAIHQFKNYVLRGSERYYQAFNQRYERLMETLDAYDLIVGLSPREQQAIQAIRNTIIRYHEARSKVAEMLKAGSDAKEIDGVVKIDDRSAINGFRTLSHAATGQEFGIDPVQWFKTANARIDGLQEVENRVREDLDSQIADLTSQAKQGLATNLVVTLAIILIALLLAYRIGRGIHHQIGGEPDEVNQQVQRIAGGDLTDYEHHETETQPTGILGAVVGVNGLAESMTTLIRSVILQAETLEAIIKESLVIKNELNSDAGSVSGMTREAIEMNAAVDDDFSKLKQHIDLVATKFIDVSDGAARLSANIDSIALASSETSENVLSAAATTGEMVETIGNINQGLAQVNEAVVSVAQAVKRMHESNNKVVSCCTSANHESDQANRYADDAIATMDQLYLSATSIDEVVELINNIAEQTNMLALNASIEAAGAGEAGKGFAVVANEVKDLAKQTGDATQLISQSIQAIQDNIQQAVEANQRVSNSISSINSANQEITELVNRQDQTVQQITQSMSHVASATQEVTDQTAQLAGSADNVTSASTEVTASVAEITTQVGEAAREAGSLDELGKQSLLLAEEAKTMGNTIFEASAHVQKNGVKTMNIVNLMNGSIHQTELIVDVIHEASSALVQSTGNIDIGKPAFDVGSVKLAHLGWLSKLEHVIRGRTSMTADEVATGYDCAFGQWYYSEGEQLFGQMENFKALGRVHLHVHEIAREIVSLANEFETMDQAVAKMEDFNAVRGELFKLLDEVYLDKEAVEIANATQES